MTNLERYTIGNDVMLCVERKILELEFSILLKCCDIDDYDNIELSNTQTSSNDIVYPISYKIDEALPFYFESTLVGNRRLVIGYIEHDDNLSFSDNDYYTYNVYKQFVDFTDTNNVGYDSLYRGLYGITVDITHKRLYYFIHKQPKLFRKELIKRLPEFYNKEYRKVIRCFE